MAAGLCFQFFSMPDPAFTSLVLSDFHFCMFERVEAAFPGVPDGAQAVISSSSVCMMLLWRASSLSAASLRQLFHSLNSSEALQINSQLKTIHIDQIFDFPEVKYAYIVFALI